MKTNIILILMLTMTFNGFCDSERSFVSNEEISYPPKPSSTDLSEIKVSLDSLVHESNDFKNAIVSDVKKRGLVGSINYRKKFYGSLLIFFILWIIWLRNRRR